MCISALFLLLKPDKKTRELLCLSTMCMDVTCTWCGVWVVSRWVVPRNTYDNHRRRTYRVLTDQAVGFGMKQIKITNLSGKSGLTKGHINNI